MGHHRIIKSVIGFLMLLLVPAASFREPEARQLFGKKKEASSQASYAYGSYAKGCLAGGAELAQTGKTWQAMRLSRNRNWGHPVTIDYIKDLSQKAANCPDGMGFTSGIFPSRAAGL